MKSVVRCFVPVACVGVVLLTGTACDRDRAERERAAREREAAERERPSAVETDRPGTATVTGANVIANQAAIDRIVNARCAHEERCQNVGAGKNYESTAVCNQRIKADMRGDLNERECPRGIDQKELSECVDEINKQDCNNPIDAISRLAACRTGDLCKNTEMPNR